MVGSTNNCFQVAQHGIHGAECRILCCFPSGATVHNNGRMRSAAGSYAPEAAQAVGQHLGGRRQRFLGPGFDGFLGERDAGEASYDRLAVLCSLYSRDEGDFVSGTSAALTRALAAQVSVVNFDAPFEDAGGFALSHDLQQLELHQPGGLVAHAQMAHEFQHGNIVFRLGQQVHRQKPACQRQLRRLEDRTGSDRRLVAARLALPVLPAVVDEGAVMGFPAMRADKALWSARRQQRRVALLHPPVLLQKLRHRQTLLKLNSIHCHNASSWIDAPIITPSVARL